MELKNFVANFAEQFDDLDPATVCGETDFRTLSEWSSLTALLIIAMVDEVYDVQLKGDDIRNAKSVADLFSFVEAKK